MKKTAIITGLTGMDGSILAEQLLCKDYKVYGMIRRSSRGLDLGCASNLEGNPNLEVLEGDLLDLPSLISLCKLAKADYFYHAAAMSVHPKSMIYITQPGCYTKPLYIEELWENKYRQYKFGGIFKEHHNKIGEIEVLNMPENKTLKVLAYKNGMAQWFPIKQISRHHYKGKLIHLSQQWGEVLVTPNHSVYNDMGQLVSPLENPNLLAVRRINHYNIRPKKTIFLHELIPKYLKQDFSKIKNHLSLEDKSLQAFMEFCGAFVSEGWTTYNKSNGSYVTCISQSDKKWLELIQEKTKLFYSGKSWIIRHKKENNKDCFRLEFNNKALYSLIRKICGVKSDNKQAPDFIFQLDRICWKHFLDYLIEGDGHVYEWENYNCDSYATTSQKLAAQVSLLWTYLKKDYSYSSCYENHKKWKKGYRLKETKFYKENLGNKQYSEIDYEGYVYDISVDEVANFVIGPGKVVVHNSHVGTSFSQPVFTIENNTIGTLNCLEAIRMSGIHTRFLHCATSEIFGGVSTKPANEETIFYPKSPYGISKMAAFWLVKNYREAYKIFACNSICFNHEEPGKRGPNFVTRKISLAVAKIKAGQQDKLYLGNLDAKRDWGIASDFTRGMQLMLEAAEPDDFVLATGETHSVREFCEIAFSHAGLDDYKKYVEIDPRFYRPTEVDVLIGDYSKAKQVLGWEPTVTFKQLVQEMVDADCAAMI
jgi:GDPmannose 4,6-dehydratase